MDKSKKFVSTLEDLGLSEHESLVYLASLSLGPSTIQKIALTAEVKRTTVYTVVDSLIKKGLMRIAPKGLKRTFVAESPRHLEMLLDMRKQKIKNVLPEMEALFNPKGSESVVKYFEGITGMRNAYESVLEDIKPKDYYYVLANEDIWYKLDEDYFDNYRKRRRKVNLDVRLIFQNTPIGKQFQRMQQQYNCQVRILPPDVNLTTNMLLIPKKGYYPANCEAAHHYHHRKSKCRPNAQTND